MQSKPIIDRLLSSAAYLPPDQLELIASLRRELLYILSGLYRTLDSLEFNFFQQHMLTETTDLGASPPAQTTFFSLYRSNLDLTALAVALSETQKQDFEHNSMLLRQDCKCLQDTLDQVMSDIIPSNSDSTRHQKKLAFLADR